MEINTTNSVNRQAQESQAAPKVDEVNREPDKEKQQHAAQAGEGPDYRISLSKESRKAVAELASAPAAAQDADQTDLSEEAAALLAQEASEKLSQTHAAISNQAIQKAVDLFT